MTTSRSASICGGCAPASHQTTLSLMVSSFANARLIPGGRAQGVVDLIDGHAVRHQRELQVRLR